ncbi:alpha/beta hydrolase [Streptomyces boluensis]|uniref:Alpha/beta hydrolase fold domain-containing protein n=1 Tax=Streptomyces boluensis TaxID=1775135 RepID=A0A964XLE1_9ACTN|nr:alpha/beta hydrolase [Streptomyces boluensis]NBE53215.1 alpha/beta hydrolase fold domain-containing protein [Streptomyces boluensis]
MTAQDLAQDLAEDRLPPDARALVDLITSVFPDLGGAVTDAAEARRILAATPRPPWEPPAVGSVEDRTIPGADGAPDIGVRVYRPDPAQAPGPRPTVLFLHGGGWVIGNLESHDGTARGLCREAGATVVAVDYRLAPEDPFPAGVRDAYTALCWVGAHVAELGGDPEALVVAGDSAGGNLSAVVAQQARDEGGPALALQVLIYPATDMSRQWPSLTRNASGYFLSLTHMRWFGEQYLAAGGDPADPRVSPLLGDLAGLPPAHVVTAGCDPLCDEGRAYAQRLREAGVPVTEGHFPRMFHGFFGFPEALADARSALTGAAAAIVATAAETRTGPENGRKNSGEAGGGAG